MRNPVPKTREPVFFAILLAVLAVGPESSLGRSFDFTKARVDPSYSGKYSREVIRPFLERMVSEGPGAFRKACRVLGLPCDPSKRPLVRVRDAAPLRPGKFRGPAAKTYAEKGPEGLRLVILFHAEYLVNGSGSLEKRLLHEMVHAAMRLAMGDDRYVGVPLWLREGMALFIAGQGFDRVRYEFTITLDAEALLDGLDDRHEARDYAEDFLAVDFLVRRGGPGSLLQLMNLLLAGIPAVKAVEEVGKMEEGTLEETFRRHALAFLEKNASKELAGFLPAYRLFQDGKYGPSLEIFQAPKERGRKGTGVLAGSLDGKALYYRAKCLFNLKRIEEAGSIFARVRKTYAPFCGLADDAAFFEAECWFRQNRIPEARAGFLRFVRDFPYSNFIAVGYHKWGLCAYLCKDYPEAKRICLGTWKAFPEEPVAENALYDASNSARAMGDRAGALDLFQTFLETYPKSRFRPLALARFLELEMGE